MLVLQRKKEKRKGVKKALINKYLDMILRQVYRLSKKMSPLSVAHTVAPSLQVTLLIVTSLSARLLTYSVLNYDHTHINC